MLMFMTFLKYGLVFSFLFRVFGVARCRRLLGPFLSAHGTVVMADVGGDKSSFDPIELQCSSIPFNDPFRFVAGEFGEWPEPEPSRTTEHQTIANSLCDDWDLELSRTAQSQRWRKAGVNRIGTKLESSYDSFAAASTDNLMLLHNCTRPSTHAPQVPASAPLARSQDSGDAFTVTTGVRPFSESKEKYDLCSYGSLKLAKLSNPMAPASPSLFDMASQMPCRHVELFSYYTACKSASSSRMEDKVTGERLNPANNESQGRDREIFVHSLPVVLPGRARLNPEQAIHIFKQRATKKKDTAALLAASYGVSSKAIRDIWTRKSWAVDTRPFWTHLDYHSCCSMG